ncbi:cation:proton antiporter [Isosphaeraceae bacterium EP7]
MAHPDLIVTLTYGLAAALACGYAAFRLGLSPIVGYLLAGIVIGPHTPGIVVDTEIADQFAEIGVVLLMFGVGLQFHLEELLAVWHVAVPGAIARSLVVTILGALAGLALGWGWPASVVLGLSLSVASTVVLMRVLADFNELHTPSGHVAVGWLVVEDLFTVLVLVMLPLAFGEHSGPVDLARAAGLALLKVSGMIALTFVLGKRFIPWLLEQAALTRSRELFTLTVLVLALGIAVGSVRIFDVSMALGAFLAGMIVGRTDFSLRAATEALPMRDAFAVLFFVSVGIMFRPAYILEAPGTVAVTLAIVLLAKPAIAAAFMLLMRYPLSVAVPVALATAQIGEFSFILASAAQGLGVLGESVESLLVVCSIASISVNPPLYRNAGRIERFLGRHITLPGPRDTPTHVDETNSRTDRRRTRRGHRPRHRAVIVGHGPVGRTLLRLLSANRFDPVVIELNHLTVRRLNSEGTSAIYGDAIHRQILESAGLEHAVALFLTSSSMAGTPEVIRLAREINPKILIFVRTNYVREMAALRNRGADVVFSGEGEVAMSMTEFLLRQLHAGGDQIDRERERIRAEFLIASPDPEEIPANRLWSDEIGEAEARATDPEEVAGGLTERGDDHPPG